MEKQKEKLIQHGHIEKKLPQHGYIQHLAKICGCNRNTVRRALFEGQQGEKSDLVRKMYKKIYKNIL